MITGHGNNISDFSEKVIYDFSSNVIENEHTDDLLRYIASKIQIVKNYPDTEYKHIRSQLAEYHNLLPSNIWVCNGSTEAFYLLAHVFKSLHSGIIVPSFAEYEDSCKLYNHQIDFFNRLPNKTKCSLLWIGNPNNPDGKIYSIEEIEGFLKNNPSSYLIIDEAYIHLAKSVKSAIDLLHQYSNIIIIRSFTKIIAIPGIRFGYIIAGKEIIEKVISVSMPWSVNSLAVEACKYIIHNKSFIYPDSYVLIEASQQLQHEINSLPEYSVVLSETTFFGSTPKRVISYFSKTTSFQYRYSCS